MDITISTRTLPPKNSIRGFKTNSDGQTRDRDFNNEVNNPMNVYDFAKICAPLNNHDNFNIITKREFILQGKGQEPDAAGIPYQYTIDEYFKINKRLTFERVSSVTPDNEIFAAMWIYPIDETQYSGDLAQSAQVLWHRHDHINWSETP